MYLSNLLQNIYSDLGQTPKNYGNFTATGGSATTFVNSAWGDLESPPETDAFKNMIAFVVRDAGGANASPEGKWGRISAYVDSTYTGTMATVTDAIASGDEIMIASQDKFPLQEVIFRVNRALQNLGTIAIRNTSLTTDSSTVAYTVPLALKTYPPIMIQYGDDTDGWETISNWSFEPTSSGSTGRLILPALPSGYTIAYFYNGLHPNVNAYNSVIEEAIHPKVATAAAVIEVLSWYNRLDENQGSNDFFLWLEGEYRDKHLPMAKMENPIWKPKHAPRYSTFVDYSVNKYITNA